MKKRLTPWKITLTAISLYLVVFFIIPLSARAVNSLYRDYRISHARNVFEEIYYRQYYGQQIDAFRILYYDVGFPKNAVRWTSGKGDSAICSSEYTGNLPDGDRLTINCSRNLRRLEFEYYGAKSSTSSLITYDLSSRTLTDNGGNTAFLGDIVLKEWFAVFGNSRFTAASPGKYTSKKESMI